MIRKLFAVAVTTILMVGCASVEKNVSHSYPVDDKLDVKITFESKRAADATQLGMLLLSKAKGLEHPIRVDSPQFFPEYFAMVNVNIEDGLLYISNIEAKNFVQVVYMDYQKKTAPSDFMRTYRERRTLDTVDDPEAEK